MTDERRKDIRFRPAAQIVVLCLDAQSSMTLVDLGSGGFSVQSDTNIGSGAVLRFRFATPDGKWATLLSAQAVHTRARPGQPGFMTGFKFMNVETPRVAADVNALIDRATAVISFS